MTETNPIYFRYHFDFGDEHSVTFEIKLSRDQLEYIPDENRTLPEWTRLDDRSCDECSLRYKGLNLCPIAANIADVVAAFKDVFSYDKVDLKVETEERNYTKEQIPVQKAISSVLGLIMATSGCPDLDKLRPMARFHLPFASLQETVYRAVSMYLTAQYFRLKNNLTTDWNLEELVEIYRKIALINVNICKRLQVATSKDASLNAVVILDTYAQMMPLSIDATLKDFEYLFASYLDS